MKFVPSTLSIENQNNALVLMGFLIRA